MSRHPAAFFVSWAALIAAAGCGTLLDAPPSNQCGADADCALGTCDVERGMCVGTPPESLRIAVEIVPATDPYGRTPLPVSFEPFDVTGPTGRDFELRDFELPVSVEVRGQLRWIGEPVAAAITFTPVSPIPGVTSRIETQTFSEPMHGEDGSQFDYSVQLLPSQEYDVVIQPNGEWRSKLPPRRFRYRSPEPNTDRVEAFDYPESLSVAHGVIVDRGTRVQQSGMIVRAVDLATGRVVSSTYTTGTDPEQPTGYFELHLLPDTGPWLFSLNASGARIEAGRPAPTYAVDPSGLFPDPEDGGVTIEVPSIATQVISYRGFVEVAHRPGQGAAAALTFTARDVVDEETQVVGSFRAMVATSEEAGHEGEFTAQLLPGTYDVVVTPTSTEHGIVREMVELGGVTVAGEVSGQVFAVPLRTRYPGTVQTLAAEPMFDAQVRGQARGSSSYGGTALPDEAAYARSSDAVTDPDGLFALPLDIGLYDVIVEPPSGTNWPWAFDLNVGIGAAETRLGTSVIELSLPVPLSGTATFAGGLPVANGEVRAYALLEEGEGSTRAIQVGRAQTDAEGRFTVLLPPSL